MHTSSLKLRQIGNLFVAFAAALLLVETTLALVAQASHQGAGFVPREVAAIVDVYEPCNSNSNTSSSQNMTVMALNDAQQYDDILNTSPSSVTITGPLTGSINSGYSFTATVKPKETTRPLKYVWEATDYEAREISHSNRLSEVQIYTWTMEGVKTITVTACSYDQGVTVTDTHIITIANVPLVPIERVSITGPLEIRSGVDTVFTATVSPDSATQPISYTWSPTPTTGQGRAVVTYNWSSTGTKMISVKAENIVNSVTGTYTTTVNVPRKKVYLPLALRNYCTAPTPTLFPIDNSDDNSTNHGNFEVRWCGPTQGDVYVLEEAIDNGFNSTKEIYRGTDTSYAATERGPTRYYYHVKLQGSSTWSAPEWVDVLWELEPNEWDTEADGALLSDLNYFGLGENDYEHYWDCYGFSSRAGQITIVLTYTTVPGYQDVQTLLYSGSMSNKVGQGSPLVSITYVGNAGQYYICVVTPDKVKGSPPYTLRATFP